jgi:hypothetical protein
MTLNNAPLLGMYVALASKNEIEVDLLMGNHFNEKHQVMHGFWEQIHEAGGRHAISAREAPKFEDKKMILSYLGGTFGGHWAERILMASRRSLIGQGKLVVTAGTNAGFMSDIKRAAFAPDPVDLMRQPNSIVVAGSLVEQLAPKIDEHCDNVGAIERFRTFEGQGILWQTELVNSFFYDRVYAALSSCATKLLE